MTAYNGPSNTENAFYRSLFQPASDENGSRTPAADDDTRKGHVHSPPAAQLPVSSVSHCSAVMSGSVVDLTGSDASEAEDDQAQYETAVTSVSLHSRSCAAVEAFGSPGNKTPTIDITSPTVSAVKLEDDTAISAARSGASRERKANAVSINEPPQDSMIPRRKTCASAESAKGLYHGSVNSDQEAIRRRVEHKLEDMEFEQRQIELEHEMKKRKLEHE